MADLYIHPDRLHMVEVGGPLERRWALEFRQGDLKIVVDPEQPVWMDLMREIGVRLTRQQLDIVGRAITSERLRMPSDG